MDKRYQIFISSTLKDLRESRRLASETVLDMRHMPVSMEQFPASPEEQFSYIKRIIDSSNYYILIIGGKYGSISPETRLSYTEMEYDYAIKKEIPVLAFIRRPGQMLASEIEGDTQKQEKLQAFIQKIGKLAVMWNKPEDLPKKIMQSLNEAFENFPRTGWVRADKADSVETLSKLTKALEETKKLKAENEKLKAALGQREDKSHLDEALPEDILRHTKNGLATWKDLFLELAPDMASSPIDETMYFFHSSLNPVAGKIRIRFEAWKLITVASRLGHNNWQLTELGTKIMQDSLCT